MTGPQLLCGSGFLISSLTAVNELFMYLIRSIRCKFGGILQLLSKSQRYWSTAPKWGHMTTYLSKDLIGQVT